MKIGIVLDELKPTDGGPERAIMGELTLPPAFWRAHFAGLAMGGATSSTAMTQEFLAQAEDLGKPLSQVFSEDAVQQADALMAELRIGEGGEDG